MSRISCMSYLVLARKYRPRNFEEMVGQEHVVQALTNALEQQRLHHAYLFTGTRGVGKTTVSRILAKSLNCQGVDGKGGITAHPCGVCQACQDIDSGRFVDYTELDAASNRGVDEVQSLLEQAVYKPVQGRFKVFMIDEVHMLTNTAFNAMLKTLEEPPEYLKFVLATTDPQKVPVTVLSRCLQFNLRPMVPETISEHLDKVLGQEAVPHDEAATRLIGRAARGSMRDALSLADQAIAFGGGALHEANVRQMLGVVDKQYLYQIIEAIAQNNGLAVVEVCDALRRNGTPAASVLEDMALALQQMALYQSVPEHARKAEAGDADAQRLLQYAAALAPDETQLLYSFCLKGREELGLAPDEYSGLVMVLLRILAYKAPPVPLASLSAVPQGDAAQQSPASAVQVSAAAATAAQATAPVAQPEAPVAQVQTPVEPLSVQPQAAVEHASTPEPQTVSAEQAHAAMQASLAQSIAEVAQAERTASPAQTVVLNTLDDAPAQNVQSEPPSAPVNAPHHEANAPVTPPWEDEHTQHAHSPVSSVHAQTPAPDAESSTLAQPAQAAEVLAAESEQPFVLPNDDLPAAQWWIVLIEGLVKQGKIAALVREYAVQCEMLGRDADAFHLLLKNRTLDNNSLRSKLAGILQGLGLTQKLIVEVGKAEDTPQAHLTHQKEMALQAAHEIVHADPVVLALKERFGAEVVPGSVKPIDIHLPSA